MQLLGFSGILSIIEIKHPGLVHLLPDEPAVEVEPALALLYHWSVCANHIIFPDKDGIRIGIQLHGNVHR